MVDSSNYTLDKESLDKELAKQSEWNKILILDHKGHVITSKNLADSPSAEEIKYFHPSLSRLFLDCLEDRSKTIGPGFNLCGEHFDILRFHPPLVYGRRGAPDEGEGEGIAYCRAKSKVSNENIHFIITYVLPIVSARAIPQMLEFVKKYGILYVISIVGDPM